MPDFAITPEDLQTVAAQFVSGALEIEAQRSVLLAQIRALGEGWPGQASKAFEELYQRWDSNSQELQATLAEIGYLIQSAVSMYEAAESANVRNFSLEHDYPGNNYSGHPEPGESASPGPDFDDDFDDEYGH